MGGETPDIEKIKSDFKSKINKQEKMMNLAEVLQPELSPAIELAKKKAETAEKKKEESEESKKEDKESEQKEKSSTKWANTKDNLKKGKNFLTNASSFAASKLETSGNPHLGAFLLLTLVLHFFDALYNNFSRDGASFQLMILLYLFLSLFAIFVIYKSGLSSQTWTILAVSLIAFFSPYVLKFNFFDTKLVMAVLIAAPIWALYLFMNPEGSVEIEKWGRRYFFVFIFFCAYAVISSTAISPQLSFGGVDSANGLGVLKEFFVDNTEKMVKSILSIPTIITRKINNTPGMDYFTGQVEDNKDAALGVYLEDLKPVESTFNKDREVIVWATIRGRSFLGAIDVKNSCSTKNKKEVIKGKVYPENVSLYYDEVVPLECRFEGLPAGSFKVTFLSQFKFSTWGDITYTYVSRDNIKSFYARKLNINQELNIPQSAIATYTNGPAAIGIISLPLPIGVDIPKITAPPPKVTSASLPNFGVTLSNKWSQGKINTVEKMEITTPNGIKLKDCYPKEKEEVQPDGTKKYSFKVSISKDKINAFTTVSCKSEVEDVNTFLGQTGVVDKTFTVNARYLYSLEKSTTMRVK